MKGIIDRHGGFWNGYTWIDQTTYLETLASDSLDLALRIEAERMNRCLYEPEEFDSERTVILAELHGNRNDPQYELDIDVTAAALRMHGYRWPTIGWQSDVETMPREALLDHYRKYYVPNNAVLVVAGDVEPESALEQVQRHFGDIAAGDPVERASVVEPNQNGERRVVLQRPGNTGYLQVAYRAPAFRDSGFIPLLVADAVLSGGKGVNLWSGGFGRPARTTSPLYGALMDSELAVSVGSALLPTEEPYLYGFSATLRDGVDHGRAESALFEALESMSAREVTANELEKAKNQVLSSLAFEAERITHIGHQLGYFATIATLEDLDAVARRIEAVDAAAVQQAAEATLRPENRTVGWVVPEGGRG